MHSLHVNGLLPSRYVGADRHAGRPVQHDIRFESGHRYLRREFIVAFFRQHPGMHVDMPASAGVLDSVIISQPAPMILGQDLAQRSSLLQPVPRFRTHGQCCARLAFQFTFDSPLTFAQPSSMYSGRHAG